MADMDGGDGEESVPARLMASMLDAVWSGVVLGDNDWNPDKSCYELADEYRQSGCSTSDAVENLINWQTAKAGGGGFVLGLPGLAFGVVIIPADLTFTTYLQMRMIATIALLHGWDPKSDRVRTLAFLALLGSGAAEAIRSFGIHVGSKLTASVIAKVLGKVLIEINKAVGFRLVTKAGSTGAVNLVKFVPIMGGLVSGGINAYATRQIGFAADSILKAGPNGAGREGGTVSDPDSSAPLWSRPSDPTALASRQAASQADHPIPLPPP